MREEFMERMAKYKQFQEEEKIHRALKEDIQEKYYIQLVEENIDLLKPEDREKFEAFKKEPNRFYNLTEYTRYIFGYSISNNHPLDDFSEDAESIIHDAKNWRSEWVKKNRVEYFKKNGIDLGDNYEDYLQSDEVKRIWPSPEIVKKFRESRNRLLNQYNNEYYENIPSHKEARKEIEALHLVDKGDSFDARIYTAESGLTCVIPNMVLTEEGYRALPLVLLCCNSATGRIDHELVHEMNHVLELAPIPTVEGSHYEILCGWDGSEGTIETEKGEVDTLQKREGKRDYELFSEIINELIAQEVSAIMERKKQFVFDSEEKHAYKGGTNYEHTFFLVRDFYKEFKKEIIESRQNGNIHIIWDKVGKENFDALNELFHEFHEHFSGYKIYGVLQSLMNQEKTEQTKIYFDLYRRSQEIMEKMRKHSMLQEAEEVVIEEVTEDQK